MTSIRHLGTTGHFCGATHCRFRLHTHIDGRWCVSTVGDYFPPSENGKRENIGAGRSHETYVFDLKRTEDKKRWDGIDFAAYNSNRAAERGHAEMVAKWAKPRKAAK